MSGLVVFSQLLLCLSQFGLESNGETYSKSDCKVVDTKYGQVKGQRIATTAVDLDADAAVKYVDVYKGIPYAKAPVGKLRFEKPQPPTKLSNVLDAENFGSACVAVLNDPKQNEDCLYLNVYAPISKSGEFPEGYPVLFWIHGGAFVFGSSGEYGTQNIVDVLSFKHLIVVTINYRLNIFGFFSTESPGTEANLGLWDQNMALRWVQKNIAPFGGDPNKVTIVGESSGAASVGAHVISPLSHGLFNRAVLMSGSPLNSWAVKEAGIVGEASWNLARLLNCDYADEKLLIDCLKGKSVDEFVQAQTEIGAKTDDGSRFAFGPHVGDGFFPAPLYKLIEKAPKIPLIVGFTSLEGGLFAIASGPFVTPYNIDPTSKLHSDEFDEKCSKLAKEFFMLKKTDLKVDLLLALAMKFSYVDLSEKEQNDDDDSHLKRQYKLLLGDGHITMDTLEFAHRMREHGSNVWLYEFDQYNDDLFVTKDKVRGSYHSFDLAYLFESTEMMSGTHMNFTEDDLKVVSHYTTFFANFVKYGDPSPQGRPTIWEKATTSRPFQHLRINSRPELKESHRERHYRLWFEDMPNMLLRAGVKGTARYARNTGKFQIETLKAKAEHDEL